MLESYWGRNFFKLHTEYLGAPVLVLAVLGLGDRTRRSIIRALGIIAILFLLVALGGHTPFYTLWYEVMPMMKKVRAPGMAFFLVALTVAVWAGFGVDRVLRREVTMKALAIPLGVIGAIALLGVIGVLGSLGTLFASEQQAPRLAANAPELRIGALRLLLFTALAGAAFWGIVAGRVRGLAAAGALAAVVVADLWSVDRRFFDYKPPGLGAVRRRSDHHQAEAGAQAVPGARCRRLPGVGADGPLGAERVGYHGNELRFYDDLMGGKNVWSNIWQPELARLARRALPGAAGHAVGAGLPPAHGADAYDARIGRCAL